MGDKITLDESVVMEEIKEDAREEMIQEELPKIQPKKNKNDFKEKVCSVIRYDDKNHTLDVMFDKYGIRIADVKNYAKDTVVVKYKGTIGTPDFEYKI